MYILGICSSPETMKIIRMVNIIINIIKTIIPIVLIVSLVISYMGAVSSQSDDALLKVNKSILPKVVASVLIFLLPTLIKIITTIVNPSSEYLDCMGNISTSEIAAAYEDRMEELLVLAEKNLDKKSLDSARY